MHDNTYALVHVREQVSLPEGISSTVNVNDKIHISNSHLFGIFYQSQVCSLGINKKLEPADK